jgi:hypothetical protein
VVVAAGIVVDAVVSADCGALVGVVVSTGVVITVSLGSVEVDTDDESEAHALTTAAQAMRTIISLRMTRPYDQEYSIAARVVDHDSV